MIVFISPMLSYSTLIDMCAVNKVSVLHTRFTMQPVVDTELALPEELQHILPTSLDNYQKWDLVELTQNYFKMLLHHLLECEWPSDNV